MSDRQTLAEHGTAFCLAALGIATGTATATVLVPLAVLTTVGMEHWHACDAATLKRAKAAALKALEQSPEVTDTDIAMATALLRENRHRIRFDPARLTQAVQSGNLPRALVEDVFGTEGLTGHTNGTKIALTATLVAAFNAFRNTDAWQGAFTQAMVMALLEIQLKQVELLQQLIARTDRIEERLREMRDTLMRSRSDSSMPPPRRPRDLDESMKKNLANRDARWIARRLVQRADRKAGWKADVPRLRELQYEWYENDVYWIDRNLLLSIAIEITTLSLPRARDWDERGELLNDLGNALRTRGEFGYGTAFLEEAIAAYRAALTERTQARAPMDWAMTQSNLGAALTSLGQREPGTERLEEAVIAFRAALTEWPQDWFKWVRGLTQMNLGIALISLGQRESGTARLEEAVAACQDALREWTKGFDRLEWAKTQKILGSALQTLGQREAGTERLEQAVAAYRAALTEWTNDRVPLDWAGAQNNLGNALLALGQREAGTARLEQAVAAYRAALTEWTKDWVPLDWAMTQMNLGNALLALGRREAGAARLEEAVAAYRAALTAYTQDLVPLDWAMTQNNLGNALWALGEREAGTARLEEAFTAYRAALTEYTQDRVPLNWATTLGNEGAALLTLAGRTGDAARARQALEQLTLAEATLRSGGHVPGAEIFARQIPVAQALVDRLSGGQP